MKNRDEEQLGDPNLQRLVDSYADGFEKLASTSKKRPDLETMLATLPKLIADQVRKTLQKRGVLAQGGDGANERDAANEMLMIGPTIVHA